MITIRRIGALLGALAVLCALVPQARAIGYPMTYQGRLKESGVPVSGVRSIDILFCPCLSGACAPACSPTGAQNVSVSSGLFRTTFTIPASVDLAVSQQWFLEVQVNATALAPREALTVSPYAVYSATSSSLMALVGTAEVNISTPVSISASSLNAPTLVANNPVGNNAAFVAKVGGIERFRIAQSGSIGIEESNPSYTVSLGSTTSGQIGMENSSANSGRPLTLRSGAGGSTGADFGGPLNLVAGSGGTSGTSSNGGTVFIQAGGAGPGNFYGGSINLEPGQRTGTGIMGAVDIRGGAGAAHLRATQTTAPTIGGFGNCGAGPTFAVGAGSTDMNGSITIATGPGPAAGCGATITFNRAYGAAPKAVLLTPANGNAGLPGTSGTPYATSGAGGFNITTTGAPGGSMALVWYYMVVE